jgi:hypothetical protein
MVPRDLGWPCVLMGCDVKRVHHKERNHPQPTPSPSGRCASWQRVSKGGISRPLKIWEQLTSKKAVPLSNPNTTLENSYFHMSLGICKKSPLMWVQSGLLPFFCICFVCLASLSLFLGASQKRDIQVCLAAQETQIMDHGVQTNSAEGMRDTHSPASWGRRKIRCG